MGQSNSKKELKIKREELKEVSIRISHTDQGVDRYWEQRRFDLVLEQVKNDFEFPKNFNINILVSNASKQHAKELLEFTRKREEIHQLIADDNLQQLKGKLSDSKSKFYLNRKNESALYTAIKNKRFEIYAFLKTHTGAEFKHQEEESVFDKLDALEKKVVEDKLVAYYPHNDKAPIYYLVSKSRSLKERSDFYERVERFYEKLGQIPEILVILKVLQHADSLDIIIDFDNDNVSQVRFTECSKNTRGETLHKEGRIYVAAGKRKEEEILGTLAHEFAHMAMELVYDNDCNPYYANNADRKLKFEDLIKKISKVKNEKNELLAILSQTFSSYTESEYASEFIVRVPQILAENQCGRGWLQMKMKDLFDYYCDVMVDFQSFINDGPQMKSKRQNRIINERGGAVKKIKEYSLTFKDVREIQNFLKDTTKNSPAILLIAGESSWLCVLKSLQAFCKLQRFDNYIVSKYQDFLKEEDEILQNFFMEGTYLLIVEFTKEDDIGQKETDLLMKTLRSLSDVPELKPNKKIIFAVHDSIDLKINSILQSCQFITFSHFQDPCMSLTDLDASSQGKILDKTIYFQNKRLKLRKLMENFRLGTIDGETIDKLISNEKIQIGSKGHGLANLDGAYADLQEEINLEILVDEFTNSKNTIFVFERVKNDVDLKSKINKSFRSQHVMQKFHEGLAVLLQENRLKIAGKGWSDEKFKRICRDNPEKDIYWTQVSDAGTLNLRKLYTPNFYLPRNFVMYAKLAVQWPDLIECQNVQILISKTDRKTFLSNFYKNTDDLVDQIIFTKTDQEAQKIFQKKSNKTIYWFAVEDKSIIFKNSNGSLKNLRENIDVKNSTCTVSEMEFIDKLKNNKVFVIADDPGMGKTTTLINLSERQSVLKNYWIIKVNLKDLNFLDLKDANDADIPYLFDYLSGGKSGENLTKSLLKSVIYERCQIPLVIFFDGFDEILEESDRDKIISWMKRLKEETEVKFLITTRFHHKNLLEDSLSTFALGFQPLDDVAKEDFIKTYLKIRLKLILDKKLTQNDRAYSIYTHKFLDKMASIFKTDLTRFIGTPLQLHLMLEDAVEHFKNWASENFQDPNFSYFGNNMTEIYSNFINKKYEYFKRTKNSGVPCSLKNVKSICERFHMELAEFSTRGLKQNKTSIKFDDAETALACGIVKGQEDDLTFIHPTFREYYVAKLLMEWIKDASSTGKLDVIVKLALHGQDYRIVRCFLNDMFFDHIENKSIPKENFDYFRETLNKLDKKTMVSSLSTLIQEEHVNLFKFFILILQTRIFFFTCRKGDSPLTYACRCNRKDVVECILEQSHKLDPKEFFKFLCKKGKSGETCLHHAAFYNNSDIVKLILDKTRRRCTEQQIRELLTTPDKFGKTPLHLSASSLGQFFSVISQEFMKTSLRNSELTKFLGLYTGYKYWFPEIPYELLSENLHHILFSTDYPGKDKHILKFMKEFVEKEKENVRLNACEIFKLILSRISKNDAWSIINAKDSDGFNVLNYAVANKDDELINFISKQRTLFNAKQNSERKTVPDLTH